MIRFLCVLCFSVAALLWANQAQADCSGSAGGQPVGAAVGSNCHGGQQVVLAGCSGVAKTRRTPAKDFIAGVQDRMDTRKEARQAAKAAKAAVKAGHSGVGTAQCLTVAYVPVTTLQPVTRLEPVTTLKPVAVAAPQPHACQTGNPVGAPAPVPKCEDKNVGAPAPGPDRCTSTHCARRPVPS